MLLVSLTDIFTVRLSVSGPLHVVVLFFFFLMIRRPPRSTLDRSSAASDVYKRQAIPLCGQVCGRIDSIKSAREIIDETVAGFRQVIRLSLIHISEPTRPY